MDGNASYCLCGKVFALLYSKEGGVVVMDKLRAHQVEEIEPLIQSVGASVLYLSPYSRDLIQLNIGGHN